MPTPQETIDALSVNLDDMSTLSDQYIAFVVASDGIAAALRAEIAALLAGNVTLAASVDAAFAKSIATEDKMRAGLPGIPPVGGTPLLLNYASVAEFDTAVVAYTGPEGVDYTDASGTTSKKAGTPVLAYFFHSADGSVSTTGPTD